jgi:hypothetical protein
MNLSICFNKFLRHEEGALNRQGRGQRIFEELIRFLEKKETIAKFPDELILEIGKFFLGAPYVTGTLETEKAEHLVVNLREYDCITFLETVIALVWLIKSGKKSFKAFRNSLRQIRYRQGRLQGYSSRLHYFSDWIYDNQKKGIIRDVTVEIRGRPLRKVVNFMTTHLDLYPPLKNVTNLRRMKSVEKAISRRSLFFIPKKILRRLEHLIRDGDLIAITTDIKGLDVQHVGFAARVRNRIHLLHASSFEGQVVLSKKTLYRYLMQSRTRTGVMVARVTAARDKPGWNNGVVE